MVHDVNNPHGLAYTPWYLLTNRVEIYALEFDSCYAY